MVAMDGRVGGETGKPRRGSEGVSEGEETLLRRIHESVPEGKGMMERGRLSVNSWKMQR